MARASDRFGSVLTPVEEDEPLSPFPREALESATAPGLDEDEDTQRYSPWQPAREYEYEGGQPAGWIGSPEQIAFREAVLAAHIGRSRARSGSPRPDLPNGQRRRVAGTEIEMATAAADAASRLIEAANRDLLTARASASPDAVDTLRITAASGYRGQARQARVWRRHFEGYYNDTLRARQALAGGPHSQAAVRYMLDEFKIPWKVAAPGFSNHQAGIAIDFSQKRSARIPLRNSTKPHWRRRWKATWFFSWLNNNAATFGFRPYTKEEWHWEYKPGGAESEDEFSEAAFEADEDYYGSQAEDESFAEEEERDSEAAYEDGETLAEEDFAEGESGQFQTEDNERYDPESEEESAGECATCGRSNLESEDARFEMEESEEPLYQQEDASETFEEEAPPIRVEKFFEVWKKGHRIAYRLAGGPEPRPFFYRSRMSTDYDGAPTAYHPKGRAAGALDHLANAGKLGNWWGIVTTNGRRDGTPYIQQPGRPERDPHPGFYVSPTSLADPRFERTDTRRYVDSTKVPYIALPAEAQDRGKNPLRGGAKLGDLAAVVNLKNGRIAYAIFADSGPRGKIGEGSAALGSALGRKRSEELDLVYVVFPGSRKQPPWPLSLETINREGARLFSQWGGATLVKRLVAQGMPLATRSVAPAGPPTVSPAPVPAAPTPTTTQVAPFAIPSPRGYNLRGKKRRAGRRIFGIVVHTTGSGPVTIAKTDAKKRAQLGCVSAIDCALAIYATGKGFPHYVIGYDGATYATCPEDYTAWHAGWVKAMGGRERWRTWTAPAWWARVWGAGRTPLDLLPQGAVGPNSSVGIELLGASKAEGFTEAQYHALARLVVDIDQRHGLGIDRAPSTKLLGHEDLNPLHTKEHGRANAKGGWDPGAHRAEGVKPTFSWSKLWSLIEQRRRTPEFEEEQGEGDAETPFLAESFPSEDEEEASLV